MESKEIEIRSIDITAAEPTNLESRTIQGTAIVFDQISEVIGRTSDGRNIREIIDHSAVTQELLDRSDIKLLYNHDKMQVVLARWNKGKGTLKIVLTETGVNFEFDAKNNSAGQVILDAVRSGDIDKCSFAFFCSQSNIINTIESGEIIKRVMLIDELYDFSVVSMPAYSQTSVVARMLQDEQEQERIAELEAYNKAELEHYYSEMRSKYIAN